MSTRLSLWLSVGLAGWLGLQMGCDHRDDLDGRRRPIPGLTSPDQASEVSDDTTLELRFDMIDNIAAASVYHDGGLIASGRGVGFALLSHGGAPGQWRLGAGANPTARVDGQVAHIYFSFDRDPGGIDASGESIPVALRFDPSVTNQLASVFINDERVADVPMTEGNAEYTFSIPTQKIHLGVNRIRLFFRHVAVVDGLRTAGSIERLAIGRVGVSSTSVLAVGPHIADGTQLDTLTITGSSRVSFYAQVPLRRAHLRLQVSGEGTASVRITRDQGASRELWRQRASAQWQPSPQASIDLSEYAGVLVRIDLRGEGTIHWGRPAIVAEPEPAAPSAQANAMDMIIVWVVSGLRNDTARHLPSLLKLAESGEFSTAISQTPKAGMGRIEVLSGSMAAKPMIADTTETLAERFAASGFKTTLITAAPTVPGEGQGFGRVVRLAGADAQSLWQRADEILRAQGEKRSLTVIVANDPALPWTPNPEQLAPKWQRRAGRVQPQTTLWQSTSPMAATFTANEREYVKALYQAEVAAVDAAIATMMTDLSALKRRDRTAIIVAGDRGMSLFESDNYGEPIELIPATYEVPLVVSVGGDRSESRRGIRLLADVYATALELAQLPPPAGIDGQSALSMAPTNRVASLRLPNRARGLVVQGVSWVTPMRGDERLYVTDPKTGASVAIDPATRLISSQALATWHSLLLFAGENWDRRRWGTVTSLRSAFSAEHR